jgi:hypothetical protein
MPMKIFKNPLYLIVILALLLETLIYTGFCFKQFRYISDEEKIRIGIEYMLKQNKEEVAKSKGRYDLYPFQNAHEFLVSSPISCTVSNELEGGLDWISKAVGQLSSYVYLEFKVLHKINLRKDYKEIRLIAITNCGDAWDPWDWY